MTALAILILGLGFLSSLNVIPAAHAASNYQWYVNCNPTTIQVTVGSSTCTLYVSSATSGDLGTVTLQASDGTYLLPTGATCTISAGECAIPFSFTDSTVGTATIENPEFSSSYTDNGCLFGSGTLCNPTIFVGYASTTLVTCTPTTVSYTPYVSSICTATVSGPSPTPTGTVSFESDGYPTSDFVNLLPTDPHFDTNLCTLGIVTAGSCSVTFEPPSDIGTPDYYNVVDVIAVYSGDSNYIPSVGTLTNPLEIDYCNATSVGTASQCGWALTPPPGTTTISDSNTGVSVTLSGYDQESGEVSMTPKFYGATPPPLVPAVEGISGPEYYDVQIQGITGVPIVGDAQVCFPVAVTQARWFNSNALPYPGMWEPLSLSPTQPPGETCFSATIAELEGTVIAIGGPATKVSTTLSTDVCDESTSTCAASGLLKGTLGDSFYDTATLHWTGTPTPTGTVTYHYYSGGTCASVDEITGMVDGNTWPYVVTVTSTGSVPDSAAVLPLKPGTYSFMAVYSGDSNYVGSSSTCTSAALESFVVTSVFPIGILGVLAPLAALGAFALLSKRNRKKLTAFPLR